MASSIVLGDNNMDCFIIGVAGGTGSGKSTFTNRLKDEYRDDIAIIYYDNYYKSRDGLSEEDRKIVNYDHPDALDTQLLINHLNLLKKGEYIECPTYDYTVHNRTEKTVKIEPKKVIVVEGILVFQNDELRDLMDIKVYVDTDADERILRRAMRDIEERGRSIEDIYDQYISTVKPMHNKYVEPTKSFADIIINSGQNDVALDIVKNKIDTLIHS